MKPSELSKLLRGNVDRLRRIDSSLLHEAEEDDISTEPEAADDPVMPNQNPNDAKTGDSVDAQIDRYLSDYESEARDAVQAEGVGFRQMFQQFINEVGEEATDPTGEELGTEIEKPDINIESFANSVVRLIDNYDSLLEMRDTIAKRAMNFLSKTYGEDVVNSFMEQLRDQYDIELDKSEDEVDAEKNPAPPADRAGEGFGSGGGAGGV